LSVTVDQLDPTPIYEQLAGIIREKIKAGDLAERQLVPSESSLQQEHGIARGSVRRAMELLREEGWVVTIQGRGTFVAPRESWPEKL
jgi:DNA-binding GntR family transcriptional regulator